MNYTLISGDKIIDVYTPFSVNDVNNLLNKDKYFTPQTSGLIHLHMNSIARVAFEPVNQHLGLATYMMYLAL